ERFKEAQEAYDVLSDPQKRQNYDQFGHAGVGVPPGAGAGADPFEAFRRAQQGGARGRGQSWRAGPGVSVEDFDIGEMGDLGGIFEQLFGGGRARAAGAGPRPGQRGRPRPAAPEVSPDLEHAVDLTFEQAARGTTLPLQINRDGRIETIEVKIPAGVKDGSRVRIKGRGHQINGASGDLYIITHITPHPYFRREELDVHLDVPISLYEALLGTKVEVPTLDGPVTLTIPPGTSGGSKLRIRGRGVERNGQHGDQIVIVRIIVPKDLDSEDRRALEALAKKHPVSARADVKWRL
ncbi:MAG TPA: DnaJ C-terminal domain-containing protein, partial [Tepidisphaeraceae bacterium]|nr:DnaJ C-terminal domain-containing protein [Tepidisphaeraceae bacterium]